MRGSYNQDKWVWSGAFIRLLSDREMEEREERIAKVLGSIGV